MTSTRATPLTGMKLMLLLTAGMPFCSTSVCMLSPVIGELGVKPRMPTEPFMPG